MTARKKFTLVEIMTAIAIFTMFMALVIQFFVSANKLWRSSERETALSSKANLALSAVEQYLRNAKIGSNQAPFFVYNAKDRLKDLDFADIMKNKFNPAKKPSEQRWENDNDCYDDAKSSKLIFAAHSDADLADNKGGMYLLCFLQAQDHFQLRVISDKDTTFYTTLLGQTGSNLRQLFSTEQKDFTGITNGRFGSGEQNNGRVTYDIIDHVTGFKCQRFKLEDNSNGDNPLKLIAGDDADPTYAILVELTMLEDNDFNTWRAMVTGKNSESTEAKKFRQNAERTFSRLIYLGNPREF